MGCSALPRALGADLDAMQGIAVFLTSNVLQLWSHSLLARLAASSGNHKGGTDVYQVPRGVQGFS